MMATGSAGATRPPSTLSRRDLVVPIVVAAPAVLVACLLVALEANRFMEQRVRPDADIGSFAGALRSGDYEQAAEYLRETGSDPNRPIPFRDAELTGNQDIMVTPLLISVATRVDNTVRMLMSAGVNIDAPGNRYALCLADRLGDTTIAEVITHDGGPAAATMKCPDAPLSTGAPLLAFAQ
jgi:hypothetical protein